jgi:Trypsin-co-occurring domain 2
MQVSDTGVAVDEVVDAVKNVIKLADISETDAGRDLRVASLQLILNTVATVTAGGGVDFRVPFIGMKLSVGGTVTRHDTHTIDITLIPPDLQHQVRDSAVEGVLLDAIATIRAVVTRAVGGDDPFRLQTGTVELCFAVTKNGSITLGFNGEFSGEITHTLRVSLEAP